VDDPVGVGLVRPFGYGADSIATSTTKYLGVVEALAATSLSQRFYIRLVVL
jgi:O-acetylhomoserine/O-acetylserine sulfhydrylase-like pyridoxal-dependent enzyme